MSKWVLPTSETAPRFYDGTQWFTTTYIGEWWLDPNLRYTPDLWADYVHTVISRGGCIALDTALDPANGYTIPEGCMEVLRTIKEKRA
jgi:hypothetical protein